MKAIQLCRWVEWGYKVKEGTSCPAEQTSPSNAELGSIPARATSHMPYSQKPNKTEDSNKFNKRLLKWSMIFKNLLKLEIISQ